MKLNISNRLIFLAVCFIDSFAIIAGQDEPGYLSYNIDIKGNINNVKKVSLSILGNQISYIPLETSPDCMIQMIQKVIFSESNIFISEYNRLLQFDRNGKFIRQIGNSGRGPEEYSYVTDFCIDEMRNEVYIISFNAPKLWIFDFNGVFKKTINLSFRPAQIIIKDNNYLMFHLSNDPGKNDPSWIISNRSGVRFYSIKNTLKRISNPGFIVPATPLYYFNNSVHFMEFGVDTLYYFNNDKKEQYAVFSLGDLKMDPDPLISRSMVKNREFLTDKIWISQINETNDFLFINFPKGITSGTMHSIFHKKTGTITFPENNTFKDDLGSSVGFWPKQVIDDSILVDYVDAYDLLKGIIPAELRMKLTETSNPVIMMVSTKKNK